jgi:hypothetical protein
MCGAETVWIKKRGAELKNVERNIPKHLLTNTIKDYAPPH